jgi:Flp pilus assembly secretin CpaC
LVRAALVLGLAFGFAPLASADDTIVVTADQARIVKIPAGAQTLVIGNPFIADVTLQNGVMIVTGKGFGETNFIAIDAAGNPVAESTIRVIGASNALVVQRGLEQQSYTCAPRCQPTVKLGDDPKYMSEVAGEFQSHSAQAGGK